jgi:cytosine/adenosine deaminase-related metal-dependent hydrolase
MRVLIHARNGSLGVEAGVIVGTSGSFDLVIDARDADVRPGLINAHDHLHRNHYGRLGKPPYRSSREWAGDIQRRYKRRIAQGRLRGRREALLAGAWKNLFSGVTTVVHHDPWEHDFDHNFPIRVASVATADDVQSASAMDTSKPYAIHCAEGVDAGASHDVVELESRGLLTARLLAVHAVGVDDQAIGKLRSVGAAIVWCPTSNMFMLGATAPDALLQSGVDVLLGSDSLLTGAGNLLDELRFARARGPLSDEALEWAVGAGATARLGLAAPTLNAGGPADLILITEPIGQARSEDVQMVMVGGVPRVAAPHLAARLARAVTSGRMQTCRGVTRWTNGKAEGGIDETH